MIPSGPLAIDLANERLAELRRTADAVRTARAARSPRRAAGRSRRRHAQPAATPPATAAGPPGPHTEHFATWASELAQAVAADGIDANRFAVNSVARIASEAGVSAAVVAAVRDPAASPALRQRALGYALVALSSGRAHLVPRTEPTAA